MPGQDRSTQSAPLSAFPTCPLRIAHRSGPDSAAQGFDHYCPAKVRTGLVIRASEGYCLAGWILRRLMAHIREHRTSGTKSEARCPSCSSAHRPDAKFCSACGHRLTGNGIHELARSSTDKQLASLQIGASVQRRQMTIMFCDLVGSTALSLQLDPEDLRKVIDTCHRCISNVATRFEGVVARYMGDGVLIYFGYPQAHEDDAERAIRAGLQAVDALSGLTLLDGYKPQVRIGVATGLVVVSDLVAGGTTLGQEVAGETPNLAARLQALAEPNTVLIASNTHRLASGVFEYKDLGPIAIKGFGEPVRVWQVVGTSGVESRRFEAKHATGVSPLVGREGDVDFLLRCWRQIEAGDGRVVLLTGEAGIGKSRIRRALQEQLAAEPHILLDYYCSPYHRDSALHPIIDQIQRAAGLSRWDTEDDKLTKLETLLAGLSVGPAQVGLVAELLSLRGNRPSCLPELSPQQRQQRIMEVLLELVARLAAKQRVLIVFEDIHWIDPTSLELIGMLVERVARLRVLVVASARPEFVAEWSNSPNVMTMPLNKLSRDAAAALVEQVTGGRTLPDELLEQILARTDGVPLFVEELTKTVLESGLLQMHRGAFVLESSTHDVAIPTTLQDSLVARLDRLGGIREIAQIGATIGREFSFEVLSAVSGLSNARLEDGLQQFVRSELIVRRNDPSQAIYAFKHTLVRDAAYSTLLRSQRQAWHVRIANVFEEQFPGTTEQQPEMLAFHCSEGGLIEKAINYCEKAGRKSAARYAKLEAVVQLRRALDLLSRLPSSTDHLRRELGLQCALGRALIVAKGIGARETGQAYLRARELCEHLGDTSMSLRVLGELARYHLGRGEHIQACRVAEDLLRVGHSQHDQSSVISGHLFKGISLFWIGEFLQAKENLECVLSFSVPEEFQSNAAISAWDMKIGGLSYLALVLFVLGYREQALSRSEEALARSRDLRPPQILIRELTFSGLVNLLSGAQRTALELVEEAISLAAEQRYPFWLEVAHIMRGFILAASGDAAGGLRLAQKALADLAATGSIGNHTFFLGLVAQICERDNRAEEAQALICRALDMTEETGERWFEAELHRLRGLWLIVHQRALEAEAEQCFRRALAVARQQSARTWELRAAIDLCRLLDSRGDRAEARQLLAPVWGRCLEEFGTADFIEAKVLLDALT
jgi:class 3 adenylate cyclase/predicted ATPase